MNKEEYIEAKNSIAMNKLFGFILFTAAIWGMVSINEYIEEKAEQKAEQQEKIEQADFEFKERIKRLNLGWTEEEWKDRKYTYRFAADKEKIMAKSKTQVEREYQEWRSTQDFDRNRAAAQHRADCYARSMGIYVSKRSSQPLNSSSSKSTAIDGKNFEDFMKEYDQAEKEGRSL